MPQMPMTSFHDLTTAQLKDVLQLKERIEFLQEKLSGLQGGSEPAASAPTQGKRVVSAATKKKMAAAQQARYAKQEAPVASPTPASKKSTPATAAPRKRTFSPETK